MRFKVGCSSAAAEKTGGDPIEISMMAKIIFRAELGGKMN